MKYISLVKDSIQSAIILAGGFGTRLKSVLSDVPKPMAPIGSRPFLEFQLDYLQDQGIQNVILCTGYQSDQICRHFGNSYKGIAVRYSHEDTPLGTGGAIKQALKLCNENEPVVILNGDSYCGANLSDMYQNHLESQCVVSLALVYKSNFDRYGTVVFDKSLRIRKFLEKQLTKSGWISAGVYITNGSLINHLPDHQSFSIETDFFEPLADENILNGFLSESYFIDIGIPEDYQTAQQVLPSIYNDKYRGWTLFLDRDGVINERTPGDYVKSLGEWAYCKGSLDAIFILGHLFDRIIVITNQQGVGLGKMTTFALDLLHQSLLDDVRKMGSHISKIYACTDLKDKSDNCRKPSPKMGLMSKREFPEIDFSKSIMVGDSATDILFGKELGMRTVVIMGKEEDYEDIAKLHPNEEAGSLLDWARSLT
ncbi:MAG: HAD-IIIA family hydrolase [Bacteroidia bacterium]|nr:HAD-IIIA family hydrolase [Bacteroidia bacterium]